MKLVESKAMVLQVLVGVVVVHLASYCKLCFGHRYGNLPHIAL